MAESTKIYCGKGTKKSDTWLKVTIDPDVIMQYVEEFQGKKFVKLDINIYQEQDKYGKDIKITIDNWKPVKGGSGVMVSTNKTPDRW